MPPIPPDIDGLSAWAYETGITPLDWAISSVETQLAVWLTVCEGRAETPSSFPGYHPDLSVLALSRRIIGHLIDAGWQIPGESPNVDL